MITAWHHNVSLRDACADKLYDTHLLRIYSKEWYIADIMVQTSPGNLVCKEIPYHCASIDYRGGRISGYGASVARRSGGLHLEYDPILPSISFILS